MRFKDFQTFETRTESVSPVVRMRGHTHTQYNMAVFTAQLSFLLILCHFLLTLTEKMLAVCPVCMESSFLWCSGSHTMVCWSSEPEASRL